MWNPAWVLGSKRRFEMTDLCADTSERSSRKQETDCAEDFLLEEMKLL